MGLSDEDLGRRVVEWRERRGLTQAELAAQVHGMTQSKLSKSENGARRFTTIELAELAAALDVDPLDLLDESPLAESLVAAARGGVLDTAAPGVALATEALRVWRILDADSIPVELGTRPALTSIPPGFATEGRSAAADVRDYLQLGSRPLANLLDVATGVGLVVFYRPFAQEEQFDGVCVADGDRAVAVINTRGRGRGRQRFTLAHEIAHWVFGDVDSGPAIDRDVTEDGNDAERRANAFAAALLVPQEAISAVVDVVTGVRAAYEYGVSVEMMANRLPPSLGEELRGADRLQLAMDAGCVHDYQEDRDAQAREGLSAAFEAAVRTARAAGAVSPRRIEGLLPATDV
ncbi:MAG: XRE family transcriptional regulator [Acidimicrobiales bacterium]